MVLVGGIRGDGRVGGMWGEGVWGWLGVIVPGRPISGGPNLDERSGLVYSAESLDRPRFERIALD